MRPILLINILLMVLVGCGDSSKTTHQNLGGAGSTDNGNTTSSSSASATTAQADNSDIKNPIANVSHQKGHADVKTPGSQDFPDLNNDTAASARNFQLPAPVERSPSGALWATFYHTLRFQNLETGLPLLAMNGEALGPRLTKMQWCQAAMEGSVQIFFEGTWRTYNYAGTGGSVQVDCTEYYDHPVGRTRFTIARGPFGDGVRNYILVPFRTIAVDPAVFPYGTVIYIETARGLKFTLNDGTEFIHDGYFFAGDTGGLIHDNHIDVFIGNALRSPFAWITSNSKSRIGYQLITDRNIRDTLTKLHTYVPQ